MRGFQERVATFVSEPSVSLCIISTLQILLTADQSPLLKELLKVFYSAWRQKLNYMCWSVKDMETYIGYPWLLLSEKYSQWYLVRNGNRYK